MPVVPSIKGSVFNGLVEDIKKLLAARRLKPDELSRWLKPKDLVHLESPVLPHEWYDIRVYARMSELLRDVEGHGRNDYLVRRGERNAKRLLDAGLYSQLEYLQNTTFGKQSDPKTRHEAFGRDLARITTISSSILNFGRWTVKPDPQNPKRWIMEVTQAKEFPDVLVWASSGFSNGLARVHNSADLWTWERPEADRIVFRMTRDL
jgi:hypothetical protein